MDGGAGGGAGSPEQRFRGGAAPELAKSAALGLSSACCLAVGGVRDVRSPPGGYLGLGRLGAASAWAAAALRVVVAGVRESRRLGCATGYGN